MVRGVTSLLLCVGLCLAQGKPPAGVDEALRARINQFFQFMVDAKYRQAESLIAEDSKDFYYNGQKPKYLSFELKTIEYSDNFTRAKATTLCETIVTMAGFAGQPIKLNAQTSWKLVDGEWFWYIDPATVHRTPFGNMTPGTGPRPPGMPASIPTDGGFAMGKIKSDKQALELEAGDSGSVTLTNSAAGPMSITLTGRIPGVDVKLDKVNLNPGDKAVVNVTTHPGAESGTLSIQVEQTLEVIPIRINVR